jgi:hypothetical protein
MILILAGEKAEEIFIYSEFPVAIFHRGSVVTVKGR